MSYTLFSKAAKSSNSSAGLILKADAWWIPRLAGPVIAAAIIRLAMMIVTIARYGEESLFQGDTISYLEPGRNLLFHGHFFADGVPDLVRTPGYPLFLAITDLAGAPVAALANVILSVLAVVLVWKLAKTVFLDGRIALGAAWIFAFEPVAISCSFLLLSEPLFLVLFLLGLQQVAEFLRSQKLRALAIAGTCLAAATFVRPLTYYLVIALALGLFFLLALLPRLPFQKKRLTAADHGLWWKAPALLLVTSLPWIGAWQMRNWIEAGYAGLSSATEINLYFQIASGVTARVEHKPFIDVRKQYGYSDFANNSGQSYQFPTYLAQHPEQTGWTQGQRLAFMHAESLKIVRAHPEEYLKTSLISLFRTMFIPGSQFFDRIWSPNNWNQKSVAYGDEKRWTILPSEIGLWAGAERAVFLFALLTLYLLAVRGFWRSIGHNLCVWLLLGTALYFVAATGVGEEPGGNMRYRLPFMPILCILASAGFGAKRNLGTDADPQLFPGPRSI